MRPTQRYQVLIIDTTTAGHRRTLEETLRERINELNLNPTSDLQILGPEETTQLDERAPKAAVYFGGGPTQKTHEEALRKLQELATVIIPVVPTLDEYTKTTPKTLHAINGVAINPADKQLNEIATYVLEA